MNNKVNYTLVGFLVLFGFSLMLGFTYWLLKPSNEQEVTKYQIYFDESVLGLNLDAPVKYRGISVGKVSHLKINPNNSEQVEVLVTILKSTPIKENTVAKLTSQGITGLSYINLSQGDNDAPALQCQEGHEYPVIQTTPSFFENFEKSLGSVSTKLSKTLVKTEELLNDDNQKEIAASLKNTAALMEKLNKLLDDETIAHLQATAKNMDSTTAKIDKMVPNIDRFVYKSTKWETEIGKSFKEIENSYKTMGATMDNMAESFASSGSEVKDIMPTVNSTMLVLQDMMIKFEEAISSYSRSPGDIIYKQEEAKKGPGEE